MAQKRKAQEAFGAGKNQVSAFAAAKLAKQAAQTASAPLPRNESPPIGDRKDVTATELGAEPYDGHHSGRVSSRATSVEVEHVTSSRPKLQPATLSTFVPQEDDVAQDDESIYEIILQENETATFIGEYELNLISGVVTVYGAVLRANSSPKNVYAPSVCALPQIQARQSKTNIRVSSINSGLRKLGRLSPLFRNIWTGDTESKRSFKLLATSDDDNLRRALAPVEIDRDMDLVLRTLSAKSVAERQQARIMTIGGKSTGKSTFNRILCNHLHSWTPAKKCLYLDLDPGQPEFGPVGQVSLVEISAPVLGPPFTHPASSYSNDYRLVRSHTIAAATFKDDPTHYKACALDLIRHADRSYSLIINACGWTSGLGASVLVDLCLDLRISDAVLLEPAEPDLIESLHLASNNVAFHKLARRPPKPAARSPADARAMQTMAYFHTKPAAASDVLRLSGKPLNRMRHWKVSFADSNSGISAIMSYNSSPNPEFFAEVLDGSVVAIVVLESDIYQSIQVSDEDSGMLSNISERVSRTPEGIPYIQSNNKGVNLTLDPRVSECVGLALVRGIDTENKTLHLITPLSRVEIEAITQKSVVLVRGSFDSPGWAYLEDVYLNNHSSDPAIEYDKRPWVSQGSQIGVEGSVWRLRHPPLASSQVVRP